MPRTRAQARAGSKSPSRKRSASPKAARKTKAKAKRVVGSKRRLSGGAGMSNALVTLSNVPSVTSSLSSLLSAIPWERLSAAFNAARTSTYAWLTSYGSTAINAATNFLQSGSVSAVVGVGGVPNYALVLATLALAAGVGGVAVWRRYAGKQLTEKNFLEIRDTLAADPAKGAALFEELMQQPNAMCVMLSVMTAEQVRAFVRSTGVMSETELARHIAECAVSNNARQGARSPKAVQAAVMQDANRNAAAVVNAVNKTMAAATGSADMAAVFKRFSGGPARAPSPIRRPAAAAAPAYKRRTPEIDYNYELPPLPPAAKRRSVAAPAPAYKRRTPEIDYNYELPPLPPAAKRRSVAARARAPAPSAPVINYNYELPPLPPAVRVKAAVQPVERLGMTSRPLANRTASELAALELKTFLAKAWAQADIEARVARRVTQLQGAAPKKAATKAKAAPKRAAAPRRTSRSPSRRR